MKDKFITFGFLFFITVFLLVGIFNEKQTFSKSERRMLAPFPTLSIDNLMSGKYWSSMEKYMNDHAPFRSYFRDLKGFISTNIFRRSENDNIYVKEDSIYQIENVYDKKSLQHITELIQKVIKESGKTSNLYSAIIPDKNYYLKDGEIPKLDYNSLENDWIHSLKNVKYIDLFDTLSLNSYYKTDIHWKQEMLEPVLQKLSEELAIGKISFPQEEVVLDEFHGALFSRTPKKVKPDVLKYRTNEMINESIVYNYERKKEESVYVSSYYQNPDPYDIFLGGASSLITITNSNAKTNRELLLFRDSFGSSIAPLLIEAYQKITLIDLRYLSSSYLKQIPLIEFKEENQDVLFLYSVPIINQSYTLK